MSKRWETFWFLLTGALISYFCRLDLSIAIESMKTEFSWNEEQKGLMLSAFFWGYAIGQIPSSLAARKFGAKTSFGFSVLSPCILTLLVPLASKTSFMCALAIRALIGLAAAGTFPSMYNFFPVWIPVHEKTVLISFAYSGVYLGEILGYAFAGSLIDVSLDINLFGSKIFLNGWELIFYFFGTVGLLWFPLYYWRVYDSPSDNPYISREELGLIKEGNPYYTIGDYSIVNSMDNSETSTLISDITDHTIRNTNDIELVSTQVSDTPIISSTNEAPKRFQQRDGSLFLKTKVQEKVTDIHKATSSTVEDGIGLIPWKAILIHPVSLTLLANQWTFGWIVYMVLTEMPSYLTEELGFSLSKAGWLSVTPYVANYISVIMFSRIFSFLQTQEILSLRGIRQWANRIAFGGASACLIVCGHVKNPDVAYLCVVLCLFWFGAVQSGLCCSYLEVSPNFSGIMNTLGNMCAALAGLFAPVTVSFCVGKWGPHDGWNIVFYLTAIMCLISVILWGQWQSSEVVPALNTARSTRR